MMQPAVSHSGVERCLPGSRRCQWRWTKVPSVGDVMTRPVRTASPDTPFRELASVIVREGIAALPVIDADGVVLGIVSESDLLEKQAPAASGSRWSRLWTRSSKSRARVAKEAMSSPPLVIGPEAPISEAAAMMLRHRIKHLPVMDREGRLAGIVSRGDLLKAYDRPDSDIEREVLERIQGQLRAGLITVSSNAGIVSLSGRVPWHCDAAAAELQAGSVDGVISVENQLSFEADERLVDAAGYWAFLG